jgi:putative tryptophan/tyrosine transport system substrate-binding protein
MSNIDKQRIAAVRKLEQLGYTFFADEWHAPPDDRRPPAWAYHSNWSPLNSPVLEPEYRRGFAAMRSEHFSAVAIPDVPSTFAHRQLIVQLVHELRLPAVYPFREFVDVGGLMAYYADLPSLWGHAAHQVDQILKGANPADLPFYQTTTFKLIINLKTANAVGLTIPPALLARADEVIE